MINFNFMNFYKITNPKLISKLEYSNEYIIHKIIKNSLK